jgi:hypothetical protein
MMFSHPAFRDMTAKQTLAVTRNVHVVSWTVSDFQTATKQGSFSPFERALDYSLMCNIAQRP